MRFTVDNVEILAVHPGRMNTVMGRTTAQIEAEEAAEGFCGLLEGSIPVDGEKAKQLIRNEFGVDGWYHIGYYPGGAYAFYDTKEALAMEINIKDNQDNRAIIAELLKNLK